jgi:hypothetical protein
LAACSWVSVRSAFNRCLFHRRVMEWSSLICALDQHAINRAVPRAGVMRTAPL